jgi:hypothetical protein
MNPVATIAVMAFGILTLGSLRPCFADSALDGVYNGINKLRVNKTSYKCVDNISFTYTIANGQLLTRVGNSDVKFTGLFSRMELSQFKLHGEMYRPGNGERELLRAES